MRFHEDPAIAEAGQECVRTKSEHTNRSRGTYSKVTAACLVSPQKVAEIGVKWPQCMALDSLKRDGGGKTCRKRGLEEALVGGERHAPL